MKVERKIGNENLIIETGKMAKQANGSVLVEYGGTVVLATAVSSKKTREGIDFFPLTVEYQEKTYAAGRIPGGYFKREGRPTEKEILTARLIDRPIRPLFPKGFMNDVQIFAIVLSSDGQNDSDIPAMIGASTALAISDIPFAGPVGAVRVGLVDDKFIVNPTFEELEKSELNLVAVGLKDRIVMLEAGSSEIQGEKMLEAIEFSQKHINEAIEIQEELQKKAGKKKAEVELVVISDTLYEKVRGLSLSQLEKVYLPASKEEREDALDTLSKSVIEKLKAEDEAFQESDIKSALGKVEKEVIRKFILEKKKRVDGRICSAIVLFKPGLRFLIMYVPTRRCCATLEARNGRQVLRLIDIISMRN